MIHTYTWGLVPLCDTGGVSWPSPGTWFYSETPHIPALLAPILSTSISVCDSIQIKWLTLGVVACQTSSYKNKPHQTLADESSQVLGLILAVSWEVWPRWPSLEHENGHRVSGGWLDPQWHTSPEVMKPASPLGFLFWLGEWARVTGHRGNSHVVRNSRVTPARMTAAEPRVFVRELLIFGPQIWDRWTRWPAGAQTG